jgi:hypothetical protein
MVLRRLLIQMRRLLHDRNEVRAWARDFWIIALQRNFYTDRYRSNASHVLTCVQSKLAARYLYAYSIEPECKNTKKLRLKNTYFNVII